MFRLNPRTAVHALAQLAPTRQRIALASCLLLLALASLTRALAPLDAGLSATRAHVIGRDPSGLVVVVAIDSRSLRAAGEWPWSRARYATALHNLRAAGANLIGFDVDFSARSSAAGDAAFSAALSNYPGDIVLPVFVQPDASSLNRPIAALSADATLAAVNIPVDRDGVVRRYARGLQAGPDYYSSLAGVLAQAPHGETAAFGIDYGIRVHRIDVLSFEDVYRNQFDPERVRGRNILIGATALELGDEFATPVRPTMSGVFLHALAFESLVQDRALLALSPPFVFFLALAALLFLWPRRTATPRATLALRHGAVLVATIVGPFVLQRFTTVSADLGLILFAQALAVWAQVSHELAQREAAIAAEREARLTFVARHDSETQLPNRRAMLEALRTRLAVETGEVAVLIFGIDRFETLRGAMGYGNANELVRRVADQLERYTGEREVFHLSTSILGQILVAGGGWATGFEGLSVPVNVETQEVDIVLRIGVAFSEDGVSAEKLLERATIALDRARSERRDSVVFHQDRSHDPAFQLALVSDVSRGLSSDQFRLVYQPKAATGTGAIVGLEALMRWRHPVYGDIPPDRFITVAEDTGAIDELTRWALDQVIHDSARLRKSARPLPISLNVSGRSLSSAAFRDFAVAAARDAQGVDICFEITETAVIGDPAVALEAIRAFRSAGIKISVDDYGSGLSSLAYLKEIAGDELKLDKSLVAGLATSARDRVIVKSTIDLAHALGMAVVAEGVEDDLTRAALVALQCDVMQGFLISRPISIELLIDFLRDAPTAASFIAPSPAARVAAGA